MLIIAGIGSRETPQDALDSCERIGAFVRGRGGYVRSGHAEGADMAFERGAKENTLVYLPWEGFGPDERHAPSRNYLVFDEMGVDSKELAFESVDEYHPAPNRLSWGAKKCLGRDFFQVMGTKGDSPVRCVVCWAKPTGSGHGVKGGTGQAVRIATAQGIPIFNLHEVPEDQIISWLEIVSK